MSAAHRERLRVGDVLYRIADEWVASDFPDGTTCVGRFGYTEEDVARARSLGYGGGPIEACARMHTEHDLTHHLVAQALGWPHSMVLHMAAHGVERFPVGIYQTEERMAFLVQRASNIGVRKIAEASGG